MERVFIGMGSNLGNRAGYIDLARRQIAALSGVDFQGFSRIYETEPVGPVPQGRYLNAVAQVSTDLQPATLLVELRRIERLSGRAEENERPVWGPRTLDLDILFFGDLIIEEPGLIIPHPRCHERWFVLKPMSDIAPDMVHPVIGKTMSQLLQNVEALNHA